VAGRVYHRPTPLLHLFLDYEAGWYWPTLHYRDFWTPLGFVRSLFFNGFHPLIPWFAFMLFGFWWGSKDLRSPVFLKRSFRWGLVVFGIAQIVHWFSVWWFELGQTGPDALWPYLLSTDPMPPLPLYMFNGLALATAIVAGSLRWGEQGANRSLVLALQRTGKMALSFYVFHVVVGMGAVELMYPERMGQFPLAFSAIYALIFGLLCIVIAHFWLGRKKQGPLEWLFRKLSA